MSLIQLVLLRLYNRRLGWDGNVDKMEEICH
jgi:hypothetical protein